MKTVPNVLLAEGSSNQVLPLARAFRKLGCRVTTLNFSRLDVGYSSRYPHKRLLEKIDPDDRKSLAELLCRLVKSGEYDMVVPCSDPVAQILSENKAELSLYTYIASADPESFRLAYDKSETMRICAENGIPHTKTYTGIGSAADLVRAAPVYPIVMKPRSSYGAIGFHVFRTEEDAVSFLTEKKPDFSEILFQEYVPQTGLQYEVAAFCNEKHEVCSCLLFSKNRWYPVSGGSSTLNITVPPNGAEQVACRLLGAIGWTGAADIDLIEDPRDGTFKVMEVNPRMSGSVKICFLAGLDFAAQILQMARGEEVMRTDGYRYGVRLRRFHTDFLWFLSSPDRFHAVPSWFSIRHTKDQVFSLSDPLPGITSSIAALFRYRREIEKRKG